jgi:hypothetical protein
VVDLPFAHRSSIWLRPCPDGNGSAVLLDTTVITAWDVTGRRCCNTEGLNQLSLDRIHHCFQAVVRAELLIDVVQVIAESLQADVERFRNLR